MAQLWMYLGRKDLFPLVYFFLIIFQLLNSKIQIYMHILVYYVNKYNYISLNLRLLYYDFLIIVSPRLHKSFYFFYLFTYNNV